MSLDVLTFGAHVDDIELSCGGTIAKLARLGYTIAACELTKGELSTRGTVEERLEEAAQAGEILGLQRRIALDIPDGNIEESQINKLKLVTVIRDLRPRFVFAPYWRCRHFDHVHTSNLVSEACFYAGLEKIDTGQKPHRPDFIFYYFLRHEAEPSFVVDISEDFDTKMASIKAHASQFHNPESDKPETFISSKEFLESIAERNRHWGLRIGTEYAEAFVVKETVRIDDPVAHFSDFDPQQIMITNSCD